MSDDLTRVNLRLPAGDIESLRAIAERLGFFAPVGRRAGEGSVSALFQAIATGEAQVVRGRPEEVADRIRRDIERSLGMSLAELLASAEQLTSSRP